LGVEKARIEVAELALLGAGLGILRLFDNLADGLLGLLGENIERAVTGLVRRDLGALNPAPVHVTKKVVLGADARVEFVEVDSGIQRHMPSLGECTDSAQGSPNGVARR